MIKRGKSKNYSIYRAVGLKIVLLTLATGEHKDGFQPELTLVGYYDGLGALRCGQTARVRDRQRLV